MYGCTFLIFLSWSIRTGAVRISLVYFFIYCQTKLGSTKLQESRNLSLVHTLKRKLHYSVFTIFPIFSYLRCWPLRPSFSVRWAEATSSSLSSVLVLLTSRTMSFWGSTLTKLRHSKVKWPAGKGQPRVNGWTTITDIQIASLLTFRISCNPSNCYKETLISVLISTHSHSSSKSDFKSCTNDSLNLTTDSSS